MTKAKAVQAKAPVRLINNPNFGMTIAEYPVAMTIIVLSTSVLTHRSLSPKILGNFSNPLLLSTMSKAGTIYIG